MIYQFINPILLKVENITMGWGAIMRLVDPDHELDFTHFEDFDDIFSGLGDFLRGFGLNGDIFGTGYGRRERSGPRRGRDIQYELEVGFIEAARGTEKSISVPRYDECPNCAGSCPPPPRPHPCWAREPSAPIMRP